jgi:hypothetical protein
MVQMFEKILMTKIGREEKATTSGGGEGGEQRTTGISTAMKNGDEKDVAKLGPKIDSDSMCHIYCSFYLYFRLILFIPFCSCWINADDLQQI